MGIFEYECPEGHITSRFVSLSSRPEKIPCEEKGCEEQAQFVVSAVRTTFHANDRKSIKGQTIGRGGQRT